MDNKLLLVKSITLLYRESQQENNDHSSIPLVQELIAPIKVAEGVLANDFGKDIITSLRETVVWMIGNGPKHVYDRDEMLQRLRVNVNGDDSTYMALKSSLVVEHTQEELVSVVRSYRSALNEYRNRIALKDTLRHYNTKMAFHEDTINWRDIAREIRDKLEPLETALRGDHIEDHPSLVASVDFGDIESLKQVLTEAKEELDERGILHLGWQGYNRMFGSNMGMRRGEFIVVGALQHNFKSDWCLNTMRQVAIYNTPFMLDPEKKPALLRLSFENSAQHDISSWYKEFYENETRTPINPREINPAEAAQVVYDKMRVNGYHILYRHIDPSEFTYRDLFDLIDQLESEGYEIHACWADYLNMINKRGCAQGPAGFEVRDLFRRVRNYMMKRKITFVTPHQLSTEAKSLTRMGVDSLVKIIANKGYWDSCKTIDQEVDMEIYLHIEKMAGISYLTGQVGKHRKLTRTPIIDQYTVYRFESYGICDDVNGPDNSRRSVGGKTIHEGGDMESSGDWYND